MTRENVIEAVKQYFIDKHSQKKWTPGKDWVQYAGPYFTHEEYTAAISTLLDEWLVLGASAQQFEKEFPLRVSKKYGVVTNSGSSSNLLMVSALRSKRLWKLRGGHIISPVAGFPTTLNPILQCGFSPAFVDIELDTLNLDLAKTESAAEQFRAKGIMFAHVLGNPPNMDKIMNIVNHHKLIFLEDCCDALGTTYRGTPLGSFGELSSYSFYPAHHITSGEGGFVVCSTAEQEKVIRSLREWGRGCYCVGKAANLSTKGSCGCRFKNWIPAFPNEIFDHKYVYEEIGYNLKPIELQCAMLLAQLNKLPDIINRRKANYTRLFSIFQKYEEYFILPKATEHADVSWFAFPLTIRNGVTFKRSEFCKYLEDNKIQTRNYFGGNLLLQPAYAELAEDYGGLDKVKSQFPNATKATTDTFFLGTSPIITLEQTTYLGEVVDKFFEKAI